MEVSGQLHAPLFPPAVPSGPKVSLCAVILPASAFSAYEMCE
jgi:hypothetical protein